MNKRTGLLATGIVALVAGLLAAGGLWYSAAEREADAVRNLARAPLGCDTTLAFDMAGEFFLFVETDGSTPQLEGSCTGDTAFGQLGIEQELPPVRVTLMDPSGSNVGLDARTGIDYDAAASKGRVIRSFVVAEPGDHTLRVEAPGTAEPATFQIAVGRDPGDGVQQLRLGAIAAAIAGLVLGLVLIVLSRRARPAAAGVVADADPWATPAAWPTAPPGMGQPAPGAGWQQSPGPPMHPQSAPPHTAPNPDAPVPPGAPSVQGQPPFAAPADPSPTPSPTSWAPAVPTEPTAGTGASGDGERSPWAPPDSSTQ